MSLNQDMVFAEESNNLAKVENKIDDIISQMREKCAKLSQDIRESRVLNDADSISERQYMLGQYNYFQENMKTYQGYKPTPYFARMDFDVYDGDQVLEEGATYFIGKEDIESADHKQLVIDWRNPVGVFYYQKTQRILEYKEYKYALILRRALEIKNAQLVQYNTEFDGESISLEGDVIDPFLLTVLRDKRRNPHLTDIIRTIQENQNMIIRRPLSENFVVQGCAGSGKTMILLHRLSYLMYNYPTLKPENIIIITPNKIFDNHIDELSRELGLNLIERYSVEEFYSYLMSEYSHQKRKTYSVQSEKSLNDEMLSFIYSGEYAQKTEQIYHEVWTEKLNQLENAGLTQLLENFNYPVLMPETHNAEAYSLIRNAVSEADKRIKAFFSEYENNRQRLALLQKEEQELSEKNNLLQENVSATQKELRAEMNAEIESESEKYKQYTNEIEETGRKNVIVRNQVQDCEEKANTERKKCSAVKAQVSEVMDTAAFLNIPMEKNEITNEVLSDCKDILAQIHSKEEEHRYLLSKQQEREKNLPGDIARARKIRALLYQQRGNYLSYDSFSEMEEDDPVRESIALELAENVKSVQDAVSFYEKTPRYNFARRNKARNEMENAQKIFTEAVTGYLDELWKKNENAIASYEKSLGQDEQRMKALSQEIESLRKIFVAKKEEIAQLYSNIADEQLKESEMNLQKAREALQGIQSDYTKANEALKKAQRKIECLRYGCDILNKKAYINIYAMDITARSYLEGYAERMNKCSQDFDECSKKMETVREALVALNLQQKTEEEVNKWSEYETRLKKCKRILSGLTYEGIEAASTFRLLEETYAGYKQDYEENLYRHKVYLQLLTHVLYYKRPQLNINFINIDEAQDISVVEYQLLQKIAGPHCRYNLYGDVNQAVYSYKGISVWEEEIPDIVQDNVYMLNENYRNTVQITEYCNQTFDAGMTSIGIAGEEVRKETLEEAACWLNERKKDNPSARAAVIYRYGKPDVKKRLHDCFDKRNNVAWDETDESKICILTTEMAKGLEFEYVAAITESMSENEQYIAFTRALTGLSVIS